MQTRTVRHSPAHIDIEELQTDEDGNQVWAVITCYNGEYKMKSEYYAVIRNGKIVNLVSASPPAELSEGQIPLTYKEYSIMRIVNGDFSYGRSLINSVESRVAANHFSSHVVDEAEDRLDNGLTDDRPYRAGNNDGDMPL